MLDAQRLWVDLLSSTTMPRHPDTCCKEHGRTAPKEAVAFPPRDDISGKQIDTG